MTQYRIKRSSIETFPKMLKTLDINKAYSPAKISKIIGCDRRTTEKMLKVGEELKMIKCDKIKLGNKIYSACKLSPKFKKFLK